MLHQKVLVANIVHEEFIKVIFGFIEFILVSSKVTLAFEHVERMFSMFVRDNTCVSEFETNEFFKLLMKENE